MCCRHALAGRRSVSVRDLAWLPLSLATRAPRWQLFDAACANAGLHIEPAYVSNHSAAFLPMLAGSDIVALSGYLTVGGQLDALRLAAVPFSIRKCASAACRRRRCRRTLPGLARSSRTCSGSAWNRTAGQEGEAPAQRGAKWLVSC